MATTDIIIEGILLIISVTGDLSADETIAVVLGLYPVGTIKNIIWDLTHGTFQSITKDGFESIAKATKDVLAGDSRQGGKTVFVGNAIVEYDLQRMYTVISEITGMSIEYNVFKTLEEAKDCIEAQSTSPFYRVA